MRGPLLRTVRKPLRLSNTARSNIVALSATGCLVRRLDIKPSQTSYRLAKAETGRVRRRGNRCARVRDLSPRADAFAPTNGRYRLSQRVEKVSVRLVSLAIN